MERYRVDLGEPADGAKIVVAVARSSTVGTLRAETEVRAQKRVDASGGLRLKELRLGCGFALDDKDIASDVIKRSETLMVDWAAIEDEDAAPLSDVQVDPESFAAADELAKDHHKRHRTCRRPPLKKTHGPRPPFCKTAVNDSARRPSFKETLDDDDPEGTYSWGSDDDVPIAFATLATSSSDQSPSLPRRHVHVDDPPMTPPRRASSLPPRRASSFPLPIASLSVFGMLLSTAPLCSPSVACFEGSSNESSESSDEFAMSSSSEGHQQRPPRPRPQRKRLQPLQPPLATSRRRDGAVNRADDECDAGRSPTEVATEQTVPTAWNSPGASSSATAAIAPATVTIGAAGEARREADAAAASEVRPLLAPLPEKKRRREEEKKRAHFIRQPPRPSTPTDAAAIAAAVIPHVHAESASSPFRRYSSVLTSSLESYFPPPPPLSLRRTPRSFPTTTRYNCDRFLARACLVRPCAGTRLKQNRSPSPSWRRSLRFNAK